MATREREIKPGEITAVAEDQGRRWWKATGLALVLALAATVPTVGDIGLTWDEPAYRFSQLRSEQWWGRLVRARSIADVQALIAPDALLFYWTYARHGINFHPPLAGQLSVLTHAAFGPWMREMPSRRMASVFEYALAVTLAYGFFSKRYGPWVGWVAAGALLFMPRVYGDGHIAGTDTPGLFLWPATALAFWKGLYEPHACRWRVLVGVLLGLAFVEKMAAIFVLVPLLAWLVLARRPWSWTRADWADGLVTSAAMLAPLGVAFVEILRLARLLPRPAVTDLFVDAPSSPLPGVILAVPLGVWVVRRLLGRAFPRSAVWGKERPALEICTAVLAFAPVVGWLGNPGWWRQTLPRLTHYYLLNTDRRGALPDIRILYLGRIYEYCLPWHNGWVLIGVTVPAALLVAAALGLISTFRVAGRDRLPLFMLLQFVTLPIFRMLPTPAHDGVRLFLPTFFFLAAFTGWGAAWAAEGFARLIPERRRRLARLAVAALVLAPSAWQLVSVHPFELSYYNEWIGGARGARAAGMELTYWYDAFNGRALGEIERTLPEGAEVVFLNDRTNPMTFHDLHALGGIRSDIELGWNDPRHFPFVWQLTQDSKASTFSRLLYAEEPWCAIRPPQLGGLRVASVAGPGGVGRAFALSLLVGAAERPAEHPVAPEWVGKSVPWLGRFWGEGLSVVPVPTVYEPAFEWARTDPAGLHAAARRLAERGEAGGDRDAARLMAILSRVGVTEQISAGVAARVLFRVRPDALNEAVAILTERPEAVRRVVTDVLYTEPEEIGGYLDRAYVAPAGR